jgi:hypothetical protein
MAFPKKLKDLCTPSLVYFILSIVVLLIAIIQNIGNSGKYTLGSYSVKVPSTILVFIGKIIYILFWTWILNLICRSGYPTIAWFLVLLPFILLFLLLGLLIVF